MPAAEPFTYALLRVVPDLARGEGLNAAIVLYSRRANFLEMRVEVPVGRLRTLAPDADLDAIAAHLQALERIARGDETAGSVARQPQSERFHWLVAPASTIVQPGPVHTGLCDDPAETLDRLFGQLVK